MTIGVFRHTDRQTDRQTDIYTQSNQHTHKISAKLEEKKRIDSTNINFGSGDNS
jgi:osmotically-inducible protein OsmY